MTLIEQAYYRGMMGYIKLLAGATDEEYWEDIYQAVADYKSALSGATYAQVKLDLGSSDMLLKGFINVDVVPAPGVQVADLTELCPRPDSSVDYVRASHNHRTSAEQDIHHE